VKRPQETGRATPGRNLEAQKLEKGSSAHERQGNHWYRKYWWSEWRRCVVWCHKCRTMAT